MKRTIDIEQEYYCKGCDSFIPDIVKMYTDGGKVMFEYLVCTHADECHRLHEHIQNRMNFEYDKAMKLEAENEKLKAAIRTHANPCEICRGHDEKSPNYGYTDYCEDCFWYPWADEEKCADKWELKE